MKIEKIQINGFGKFENKNIELNDGINIIVGKNESGKSTLLKFINSMLYGISKNKRGKNISDLEKYKPWNAEKYSGKIKYKLDDNNEFEIYRNFKNKELKIYNNFGDDITPLFNVEKNKEIPFFYEQTKVDEDLFVNSTEIIQNEIKIDKVNQNLIIQKLSNLATTGNDNISYKKSIDKLNKKQLEEIGTERSQDRPINKIINKIDNLKNEKKELEKYEDEKYEIEKEYLAVIKGEIDRRDILKLERGVQIEENTVTAPAKIQVVGGTQHTVTLSITIHEGRNREVRKMLEAINKELLSLMRIRIGGINLGKLPSGEYRELNSTELAYISSLK